MAPTFRATLSTKPGAVGLNSQSHATKRTRWAAAATARPQNPRDDAFSACLTNGKAVGVAAFILAQQGVVAPPAGATEASLVAENTTLLLADNNSVATVAEGESALAQVGTKLNDFKTWFYGEPEECKTTIKGQYKGFDNGILTRVYYYYVLIPLLAPVPALWLQSAKAERQEFFDVKKESQEATKQMELTENYVIRPPIPDISAQSAVKNSLAKASELNDIRKKEISDKDKTTRIKWKKEVLPLIMDKIFDENPQATGGRSSIDAMRG